MRNYSKKTKKISAFTLMEVVVAIMISSILIPSLVIALGHTSKKGAETLSAYRDSLIADSILRREIEELTSLSYTNEMLTVTKETAFDTQESEFSGTFAISYVDEKLASSVTDKGYKHIILSVTTPRGKEYEINAYVTAWK